jgi:hypothetical protein
MLVSVRQCLANGEACIRFCEAICCLLLVVVVVVATGATANLSVSPGAKSNDE